MSETDSLHKLFHHGLSLLDDDATPQEWRDLIWDLQRAVPDRITVPNRGAEAKADEDLTVDHRAQSGRECRSPEGVRR